MELEISRIRDGGVRYLSENKEIDFPIRLQPQY